MVAVAVVPRGGAGGVFPGGEIELELSLANEDVLSPGHYDATVAIVGPEGWRWQRSIGDSIGHGRGTLARPCSRKRSHSTGLQASTVAQRRSVALRRQRPAVSPLT